MDKNGRINFQITDKNLQKSYANTLKTVDVSESLFMRIAVRQLVACVQSSGHLPAIPADAKES